MTNTALPTAAPSRHDFHPTILREYDIRGIVGETLHAVDAYFIGRSFGTQVVAVSGKGAKVCVGLDGRVSSPVLEAEIVKGLVDCGVEVIRIGLGPTPMLYFAVCSLRAAGGIMITGSHNPPTHNGFKFMLGAKAFFGEDIRKLGEIAASGGFALGVGNVQVLDVKEEYLRTLLAAYDGTRALTVAWDAGNGAAGEVMRTLCEKLPGTHFPLFAEIDGSFPNHHPDPTVAANLQDLIAAVREKQCDLGVAFDGDGDRIGVVDGEGEILWGDQLMVILARDVLSNHPGSTIIADVKASQTLFDEIAKAGGKPLMWKTGHSLVKTKMKETKAPLAGEMSGHVFFADRYYGYDDGLYAAVRLLGIMARESKSLAELRKALPQSFSTPELRFACDDTRKFAVIEEVTARLREKKAKFSDIDGVRVMTEDGWWLLRASNTQAVLVARAEAGSKKGLETLKSSLKAELAASGLTLPDNLNSGH